MRIFPWSCLLVGILLLAAPQSAHAQGDDADASTASDEGGLQPGDDPEQESDPASAPAKPETKDAAAEPTPDKSTPDKPPPLPPLPVEDGAELGGELPPPPPGFSEVKMDEASPVKPPLNLLDLHGYLRVRGDLMDGLDLGLEPRSDSQRGAFYPQFPSSATGKTDTLAGANMRFRLEPTINISEDVRIMAQIDMLDNLVLGSTPDGYPKNGYYPMVAFSQGQNPPVAGWNSVKDSILVKRAWGEVMTPLGLLRFGRMGSQWGLGILANDGGPAYMDRGPLMTQKDPFDPVGRCFDCDFGSTADRIMFVTKIAGHYFVPMVDFTSEGPYFTRLDEFGGQPFDIDQLDDVTSWILAVAKRDKPEDVKQALAQDDWVLNYGFYFVFRNQALDAIEYQSQPPSAGALQSVDDYAVRNVEAYIPDVWLRFQWRKLRIEMELVMIAGKIGYDAQGASLDADGNLIVDLAGERINLLQFGGVFQADYTFLNDQLIVGFELGFASGDDSPGFGVRPFEERQFDHRAGIDDNSINNFRFHPDYRVDMILWRQIIGTVTDAIYVRPSLQYNIAEGLGTKVSAIYSSAVYPASTRGKASPLGLELNADFFYFSDDNFHAGLSYGILFPFSGMSDLGDDEQPGGILDADRDDDADIAHRIMARLVLYF